MNRAGAGYPLGIEPLLSTRTSRGALSPTVLRRVPRVLGPATALLALGLLALAASERRKDLSLARREAEGVVRLQAHTLEREVELVALLLPHLALDPALAELATDGAPTSGSRGGVERFTESVGLFETVRLLDLEGRTLFELHRSDDGPTAVRGELLEDEGDRDYLRRVLSLEPGRVHVGTFTLAERDHRFVDPPRAVMRFATPVVDGDGAVVGVLDAEYLGAGLFERLERAGEPLPGWTALVNARGYYLEAPEGGRSWGFLLGLPPTFASDHREVWTRITGVERGNIVADEGLYVHERVTSPELLRISDARIRLHALAFVPKAALYAASWRRIGVLSAGGAVVWLFLAALAWRLAFVGTVREARDRQLVESRASLRQLSSRLMDLQEEERRALSRDLHDDLGQEATALIIELERALRVTGGDAQEPLERARTAAQTLLAGLHRVSRSLRANLLDDLGLGPALEALVEEAHERFGFRVDAHVALGGREPSDQVARNVYRLVQEALTNVAKHARADVATVEVTVHDGRLDVLVSDDGVGFEPGTGARHRLGLVGMRERAEQLGGVFVCTSSPGAGTRIEVRIPLGDEADEVTGE